MADELYNVAGRDTIPAPANGGTLDSAFSAVDGLVYGFTRADLEPSISADGTTALAVQSGEPTTIGGTSYRMFAATIPSGATPIELD